MMPWQLKEKRFQTALTAKKKKHRLLHKFNKKKYIRNFAAKKITIHKLLDFKKS